LIRPLLHDTGGVPMQWLLLGIWAAMGLVVSIFNVRRPAAREFCNDEHAS
jgi:hypothetical protein